MKKSEAIRSFERRLGYEFSNLSLLVEALTHSSIGSDFRKDNQRLEFLGDRVLGLVMACLLYTSPSPRDMRRSRMPSSA